VIDIGQFDNISNRVWAHSDITQFLHGGLLDVSPKKELLDHQ